MCQTVIIVASEVFEANMSDGKQNKDSKGPLEGVNAPKSVSRRSMLKGTATAMPAILTLQSGAALARSSNLISTIDYKSPDRHGRTLCLNLDSVVPAGRDGKSSICVHRPPGPTPR